MAKKVYIGAPKTEVVNSTNLSQWFTFSDPDGISSWNGNTITVTGVSGNERVKFTALQDMTVSFDYTTDSFCKISLNGQYICEDGESGTYTGTLKAGKYFYFSNSSAISEQTCTFSNITCTTATSVARQVKKMYVGIDSEIPIYSEGNVTKTLTTSDIEDVFTVTNGSYYFAGNGTEFKSNNKSKDSSTATTTLTAKVDISAISFSYSVSSESNYDKLTITVGSKTVANAISGTSSSTWSGSLTAGQTIVMTYAKDGSQSKNNDCGTISNIIVTYYSKVQTGTERKDVARLVKKGYIGIGNVARPFLGEYELAYYGTATALTQARNSLASTTVGDYALFAGGAYGNYDATYSSVVDAYNKSLTRSTPSVLSEVRMHLSATSVGNYAIFAGGYNTQGWAKVNAYNTSLTRSTPTDLEAKLYFMGATRVGDYALFAGGAENGSTTVYAYNTSLTQSKPTALSKGRYQIGATTVGNYAVFAGGRISSSSYFNTVDAYNTSLTRSIPTALTYGRHEALATTVGNYALFGGGTVTGSGNDTTVETYDVSLTKGVAPVLSDKYRMGCATTVGNYALFAGTKEYASTVDVYDKSLTKGTTTNMSTGRRDFTATTLGNYALFGGGEYADNKYTSAVDVYTLV